MSLHVRTAVEDGVANIVLVGAVDAGTMPALNRAVTAVARSPLRQLVLDVSSLTHLSAAGVRCLVHAHQRLGGAVEIVILGACEEVAEAIQTSGFRASVTIRRAQAAETPVSHQPGSHRRTRQVDRQAEAT
jgi:anti-anti-sigma factor